MTEEEKDILKKIVEINNLYCALSLQHPSDGKEWVSTIHELQRIVMSRVAVRQHPDFFFKP